MKLNMNSRIVFVGLCIAVITLLISTVTGFALYSQAKNRLEEHKEEAEHWLSRYVENNYESKIVEIIKGMKWDGSNKTIGNGAEAFMSNSKFEGALSDKGKLFVTLSGGITYLEKPAKVELQFVFEPRIGYVEVNGTPMSRLMGEALVEKMCQ